MTGEIIRLLSPHGPKLDKRILYKMGARPKKDRVDMLLIGELREEEIEWTNYEQDRVKNFRFDRKYFIYINILIFDSKRIRIGSSLKSNQNFELIKG